MATNVGSLNINIQAGTAQFDAAIDKVQKGLKSAVVTGSALGSAIGGLFEKLAEQAADLAKEMYEFTRSLLDTEEQMLRLAQVSGTTTEKLSVLAFAGKLSAVSTDELASSMTHLEKTMADAASGNLAAREAFQAIGVSVTDAKGKLRDTGDVFVDVAKKLSGYRDDANKARLMQDIFGKSGAQLIAMMNEVGTNYDELKKKAQELGIITGKDAAEAASNFNAHMAELGEQIKGVARKIVDPLVPNAIEFLNTVSNLVTNIGKLVEQLKKLGDIQIQVGNKTYSLITAMKAFDAQVQATNKANTDLAEQGLSKLGSFFEKQAEKLKPFTIALQLYGVVLAKTLGIDIDKALKGIQAPFDAAKKAQEDLEKKGTKTTDTTTKPSVKLPPDPELAKTLLQYKERIKQLQDAATAQKMLNSVVGQGIEAQAVANGLIQAENAIRELNKSRQEKHIQLLTAEQEATIRSMSVSQELNKLMTDTATSLEQQTQAAELAYEQQVNLTNATVQGADAVEQAHVANQILAADWGKSASFLDLLNGKVQKRNDLITKTAESARKEQDIQRIQQLQLESAAMDHEIQSINEMTAAILEDDAARQLAERHALERRQQDEIAAAKKRGATQEEITHIEAVQKKQRDAFADQQRQQTLQQAQQDIQGPEETYKTRLSNLQQEAVLLQETQKHALSYGQTLAYAAQQDDALIAKQQKWIQLLLTSHKAMDGVNAFFLELQVNAKTAAQTVYDVMTTAFEGLSDYLAKVMTGTKASFGDLMRSIAEMIAKAEIQSLLTNLLTPKPGAGAGSSILGSLFSSIGGLFGHRQAGGPISAGRAWLVGESGPEIITGVSGYVHSASMTRGMLGGAATVVNYAIDARGTDPALTERRTRAAIIAAHQSSVVTSIQASNELTKRRPPKGA